ncbi:hypothetical protein [Actinoplanes sp. NPDC049118]|uniref:hypothetical protein n=1 Tax=Actinoplanes sp. NPDC049118 TaxID=3155769 RepID=UPI0033F205C7
MTEASVAVVIVSTAIAENPARVVDLDLAGGPAVIANLEIPDRAAPPVELIASGFLGGLVDATPRPCLPGHFPH